MFSSAFKVFSLFALASLPAARAATMEVVVGGPGILKYTPESVVAQPGDVVRFIFQQKNHTATQSTFANPCVQAPNGFDSGFVPVADDVTSGFQVAEFSVTSTDPVWVYCKQGTHCSTAGMVFAINPGDKMAAFKAAAVGAAVPSTVASSTPASTATTAAPTSSTAPKEIKVVVGGTGILAFNPTNIQANVGDTVTFEFHQKNHSVVASSFDAPCVPLSQSVAGSAGFNSGYFPVADTATTFPTYSVVVNNTAPIWAYCSQVSHCGQGMVFSVNAVEGGSKSFAAFQALAKSLNGTATTTTTTGSGYGSGALSNTVSGASAVIAAFFAIAALL